MQASYFHHDSPMEALVYAQCAPEVSQTAAEIDRLAQQREELKITVDSTLPVVWPFRWYLRNYSVDYPDLTTIDSPPSGDVLILAASNEDEMMPFLDSYGPGQRIRTLFWFPERYKGLTAQDFFTLERWEKGWRYFLYREIEAPPDQGDTIVYFPKDFAPTI